MSHQADNIFAGTQVVLPANHFLIKAQRSMAGGVDREFKEMC